MRTPGPWREPLRGAEVALKLAASLDADAARQLVAKATDLAFDKVGSPHAPELLQKVVGYYCSKGHYREALQANNTLLEALDRARMSEGAPLYRCLAAQTILALADGSDVQKADAAFLETLGRDGYAASKQAQAAEDLLQCFKAPDDQAFDDAVASPALQSLDHAVAQVAKALPRPVVVVESAAPAVAPAPGLTLDDEDERRTCGGPCADPRVARVEMRLSEHATAAPVASMACGGSRGARWCSPGARRG